MMEVLDDDQSEQSDLLHVEESNMGDIRMICRRCCNDFQVKIWPEKNVPSLNEKSKDYGLKMNASKTNVMAVAREDGRNAENIRVDGSTIEELDNFSVSWCKNPERW